MRGETGYPQRASCATFPGGDGVPTCVLPSEKDDLCSRIKPPARHDQTLGCAIAQSGRILRSTSGGSKLRFKSVMRAHALSCEDRAIFARYDASSELGRLNRSDTRRSKVRGKSKTRLHPEVGTSLVGTNWQ